MSDETNTNTNEENTTAEAPKTWEAILESLPDEAKGLYETHTAGLKSALQKERETRSNQESQLRELAKKADKGSELEAKLTEQADAIAEANKRADFYEEAARPEIGCTNAKLAYIVAQTDGLFDKRGSVNWDALKKDYPEVFGKPKIDSADAGSGRDQQKIVSIDDRLRAAAKK